MRTKTVVSLFVAVLTLASTAAAQPRQEDIERLRQRLTSNDSSAPQPPGAPFSQRTDLISFAWELFLWSVQGTAATVQDGSARQTASVPAAITGKTPLFNQGLNPLIFEALCHRSEAYPYFTGSAPQKPILQAPYYRFRPLSTGGQGFSTAGNYVNLDEIDQIGQNMLYYRQGNDPSFPVLFMAKVNDTEVGYAWDRSLAPSNTHSWVFPNATLEVKAAWRRVSDFPDYDPGSGQSQTANTMHQAVATYYVQGTGDSVTVESDTFALLALHLIQKSAQYPSFVFATFENINAVSRNGNQNIVDPAYQLAYCILDYEQGDALAAKPLGAYTINAPGQSGATDAVQSINLPSPGGQPTGFVTVVQPKTITAEVNDFNNYVQQFLAQYAPGSIWANYRLKGVQYMPTSDETTPDYYLANIVVESSQPGIQLFRGGTAGQDPTTDPSTAYIFYNTRNNIFLDGFPESTTGFGPSTTPTPQSVPGNISLGLQYDQPVPSPVYNMGGCMGCHGVAQQFGGDFSFLASQAGYGKDVSSVPSGDLSPEEIAAHLLKIQLRRARQFYHKGQ